MQRGTAVINVKEVSPPYWDDEVHCLSLLLKRGGWKPFEVAMIERNIRDRAEQVTAGLASYTSKFWTDKIQHEIDDRCRLRWDFKNGWVLDRWAEGRWQTAGVFGFNLVRYWLIDYLRECDMQDTSRWPKPEDYLVHKRAVAFRKQAENWRKGNERLMAVIDHMSDAQIRQFIMVERAMQTGETVHMSGPTQAMYEKLVAAALRSPAPPRGRAINPGMHPFIYKRQTGGRHRLE